MNAVASLEAPLSGPERSLLNAIRIAGSQGKLGEWCGVSQAAVSKRVGKGQPAAAEWVLSIEARTGISRHELRPDLYPLEVSAVGRTAAEGGPGTPNPARSSDYQLGEPVR